MLWFRSIAITYLAVALLFGNLSNAQAQAKRTRKSAIPTDTQNLVPHVDILGYDSDPGVGDKGTLSAYADGIHPVTRGFKILQVIDADNVIGELCVDQPQGGHHYLTLWFIMPTKDMVDDKVYDASGRFFEITGTKQYTTVLGAAKTVMVAKLIDTPKPPVVEKKESANEEAAEERAEKQARLKAERDERAKGDNRSWSIASSGEKRIATFVCRIGDKIKLKQDDGTIVILAVDQLSDEDRTWLQNRSKH
jgi:hypothetical protein